MLKGYRRRFVSYNMLLVGVVLLIALIIQGVYLCRNAYSELNNTMRLIVEPLGGAEMGGFRFDNAGQPPEMSQGFPDGTGFGTDGGQPPELPDGEGFGADNGQPPELAGDSGKGASDGQRGNGDIDEMRVREEGILAVFYDSTNDTFSLLSRESFLDETALEAAVRAASEQTDSFGKLSDLDVYYYKEDGAESVRIALADTDYLQSRTTKYCLTLALVYVVTMILVYFISRRLSKLAAKPMEDAVELERQFVADISHDLKTPITVILANNSILRSNPDYSTEEREQWLSSTDEAAKNMMQLVGEMLTLSNLESVGRNVVTGAIDLSSAAEKASLQLESLAYERGVEIDTDIAENITVRGDAEYCARICGGLTENALKYEPVGGRVTVSLRVERKHAVFSVRNQGSYIAPEDLPHIFERFYRGDKARSSRGGHGLGLPIIRQMTELLGGTIRVQSTETEGTVFTVEFLLWEG